MSRVLVFTDKPQITTTPAKWGAPTVLADLSQDWKLSFPGIEQPIAMKNLRSWTEDEATRYFSGEAVYVKEVELSAAELKNARVVFDFGLGTPLTTVPKVPAGMRAMLESPVREAAQVIINGQRAGSVWHPPYELEITSMLHAGKNRLDIRVANLGVNVLAGHAAPDYRLLSARFGQRFVPQDTDLVYPRYPRLSGILGSVRLMREKMQ